MPSGLSDPVILEEEREEEQESPEDALSAYAALVRLTWATTKCRSWFSPARSSSVLPRGPAAVLAVTT